MKPDEQTKIRIKNLAVVGTAINELVTDVSQQTTYFVAKEALNRFQDGINKLELDQESKKGMKDLIDYLHKKIDRRMKSAV